MSLRMELDDRGLSVSLEQAPEVAGRKLIANMRVLGAEFVRDIRGERLSGQMLSARTGMGRRSIFYRLEAVTETQGCDLVIGADLSMAKYMRAQALGADIVPRTRKWLTIPIGEAKTAKGVMRFSARLLMQQPSAAGYEGSFISKGVIFGIRGAGKKREIVPLFVLRRAVTLPSRDYLDASKRALEKRTQELLDDVVTATVKEITK